MAVVDELVGGLRRPVGGVAVVREDLLDLAVVDAAAVVQGREVDPDALERVGGQGEWLAVEGLRGVQAPENVVGEHADARRPRRVLLTELGDGQGACARGCGSGLARGASGCGCRRARSARDRCRRLARDNFVAGGVDVLGSPASGGDVLASVIHREGADHRGQQQENGGAAGGEDELQVPALLDRLDPSSQPARYNLLKYTHSWP